jgi:hypothetical protein
VPPLDPATAKQLSYLRILGVQVPPTLTKKKAQHLINKAKAARRAIRNSKA